MPLDTQPLSRSRQLLMVAVLLALFAGSLGLAQYLVVRRAERPVVRVDLSAEGFGLLAGREGAVLPDELQAWNGVVEGHARRVDLFVWSTEGATELDELGQAASDLFVELMNTAPQSVVAAELAGLAGVQAQGTGGQPGRGVNGRFAMVRLAASGEHIVAICYSGPAPYTDADKETFGRMCASGVRMNESPSSPSSTQRGNP